MDGGTSVLICQMPDGTSEFLSMNTSTSQSNTLFSTTDTIHIDMPNKSDGTLSKVPILLQMPEELRTLGDSRELEVLEDTIDLSKFDQTAVNGESVLSPAMLDDVNLEDFVDVVTTYQCKFCRFNCPWKSGLMSHIRNAHISRKRPVANSTVMNNSSSVLSLPSSDVSALCSSQNSPASITPIVTLGVSEPQIGSSVVAFEESNALSALHSEELEEMPALSMATDDAFPSAPVPEYQIFLCGSCQQRFDSLDACKKHIYMMHQLEVESVENAVKVSKRKLSKPRKKRQRFVLENEAQDKSIQNVAEETDGTETLSKRKVRPPRALSEDYLLSRKRKYSRRPAQDKSFRCEFKGCNLRFKSVVNVRYHVRCHKEDERAFQCVECPEKSEHWREMTMHLWKAHRVDLDLYACAICGYRTCSSFKLENHNRIHSEERLFVCNVCRKGFKQMSQLRNHQVVHVDRKSMTEKRWFCEQKCEICTRKFSDSKCLRKHMQAVHNKVKPYVCSFCGHTSARKAMLELHMRCHTGEKPFACDICDYRTGDHNSLRRHKMRHSGTKPYKCRHCNYACIQAISYKTHMRSKHPNSTEGLYCCSLCSFRSVSADNYVNHMSDHKRGLIQTATKTPESVVPSVEADVAAVANMAQLEEMLPGNLSAAHLIYSCLNALSQQSTGDLPPGVSACTQDGTQTITIQLPNEQGGAGEADHIYLTIQQPEGNGDETQAAMEESSQTALEREQAQALLEDFGKVEFTTTDGETISMPLLTTASN